MMSPPQKLLGLLALLVVAIAGTAVGVWQVQEWRYGKQMIDQENQHQADLTAISNAAAAQISADQAKRLALEKTLAQSDQTYIQELSNARLDQARLRDRLATADLATSDSASGCSMPATSTSGGVVHGATRAQLDPAHAQRIISITDAGDQGLIALTACQAYVKAVSTPK